MTPARATQSPLQRLLKLLQDMSHVEENEKRRQAGDSTPIKTQGQFKFSAQPGPAIEDCEFCDQYKDQHDRQKKRVIGILPPQDHRPKVKAQEVFWILRPYGNAENSPGRVTEYTEEEFRSCRQEESYEVCCQHPDMGEDG